MTVDRIVRRVPARVGLVGNPSDLHGGAVVAAPVAELAATVEVERLDRPASPVEIIGPTGRASWPGVDELRTSVRRNGHPPDHALVTAGLLRTIDHLGAHDRPGWRITWATDIPRSVGLAGSSAIAAGVVDAVSTAMRRPLDPLVVAALALAVETTDLGVVAGWQDRIVQAVGRPVLVDTQRMVDLDGVAVPTVDRVVLPAEVALLVAWLPDGAEDSGDYHRRVAAGDDGFGGSRGAAAAGDRRRGMETLADAARAAAAALGSHEVEALDRAVRFTWATRARCAPLRADHAALVDEIARSGVAATTPGSGGSAVALLTDQSSSDRAASAAERMGARWIVTHPGG